MPLNRRLFLCRAIIKAGQGLADAWILKTLLAVGLTTVTGAHGGALFWFAVLVLIDLISRWVAIGYTHLKDCGKNNDLASCLLDIPAAWKAGYINSDAMKHRFAGKIILYVFLTIMSASADNMIKIAGETPIILKGVWIYLAATEGMSILENLRDAGVEQANGLLDFVRSRLSVLTDRLKQK